MSCQHMVYHPPIKSEVWWNTLNTLRQEADHGSGAYLPILAEQLFGECEGRNES